MHIWHFDSLVQCTLQFWAVRFGSVTETELFILMRGWPFGRFGAEKIPRTTAWTNFGQKVGQRSVRYFPALRAMRGFQIWDSGAQADVIYIAALCMNGAAGKYAQSGVLVGGLLPTELTAKLETGVFELALGQITEEVLALICAFWPHLGLGIDHPV